MKRYKDLTTFINHQRKVGLRKYSYLCLDCGHEFSISHYTKFRNSKVMKNLECFNCHSKNVIEKIKGVSCGKYK